MKKLKIILTAFVINFLVSANVQGQSIDRSQSESIQSNENQSYAMLIRNMNHLNAAIKTVQMLEEDEQKSVANFEVVICGKEVKNLREHSDLICSAKEHNIKLSACGMSLKKFSVPQSALPAGIQVVPNGLIRLFELQELGYHTITL